MSADGSSGGTFAVHAACIRGVEAVPVVVEVSLAAGIPGISIVGMADAAVLEARSRIRCALRSSGYDIPRRSVTVSLSPGDIRKTGSGFDLPIAVAILALSGQIPKHGLDSCLFAGELALDGSVCGVRGEVAYQLLARSEGLSFIGGKLDEHVSLDGVDQGCLLDLGALRSGVGSARRDNPTCVSRLDAEPALDYSDVIGQEIAKRALSVAAVGNLGMLMIGAPGSGKSMLAQRMCGILPAIDEDERQEALCIHSVAGEGVEGILRGERPFRSPHHSISAAGLIGGGRPVRPGEISLAHGGVLFLDELAEFSGNVLQMLRQPLEEGCVRIVRAEGAFRFPARFQLLAASNPCPCGYLGDRDVACRCSASSIERYRSKLVGPLADRIDIVLDIRRPSPELIVGGRGGLSTAELREDVQRGRAFAAWRESRCDARRVSDASPLEGVVSEFCLSDEGSEALRVARRKRLSGRGIVRLCRIARSIADMEESPQVQPKHVLEASQMQGRGFDDER